MKSVNIGKVIANVRYHAFLKHSVVVGVVIGIGIMIATMMMMMMTMMIRVVSSEISDGKFLEISGNLFQSFRKFVTTIFFTL